MSIPPPPPPVGTIVPSDDWTDDPSFELSSSPNGIQFKLPSSPSSTSTSPSTQSQTSNSARTRTTSSPLRQVYSTPLKTKSKQSILSKHMDDMDDIDGFDEDDFDGLSTHSFAQKGSGSGSGSRQTSVASTSSHGSLTSLSKTVMGTGPKGIGTITKLGSNASHASKPTVFTSGTMKARAKALEAAWEADLDFDDIEPPKSIAFPGQGRHHKGTAEDNKESASKGSFGGTIRRYKLSPSRRPMPPPDALDHLGFDDVDFMDEEDQTTLKAGSTIKALLPPPKSKPQSTISKDSNSKINSALVLDNGLEDDFILPLNMTNLALVPQEPVKSKSKSKSKARISNVSTNYTDWDSPNTSTSASASNRILSETSGTSFSEPITPFKASGSSSGKDRVGVFDGNDEENMEEGILLPSPTFFASTRTKDLNAILDKKRKPQFGPVMLGGGEYTRHGTPKASKGSNESIEDGLVFDNPRVELSNSRLKNGKRARSILPHNNMGTYPPKNRSRMRTINMEDTEKEKERERERGWGRYTPPGSRSAIKDKTQSSVSGLRSQSASVSQTPIPSHHGTYRRAPSPNTTARASSSASTNDSRATAMPPPPFPPATPGTLTRGLRHQKSQYHLPLHTPLKSPSLARKQSLASLQDALSAPLPPPPAPSMEAITPQHGGGTGRYHHSTSRLTMPTSSSKAKSRPPISSIFPSTTTVPDSTSTRNLASQSGHILKERDSRSSGFASLRKAPVEMHMPKRSKAWGDGTELEGIEDLEVEKEAGGTLGRHTKLAEYNRVGSTPRSNPTTELEKRKKISNAPVAGSTGSKRTKKRQPAALIRNLTAIDRKRVVGEMTWNPQTLRWEGNDDILREFDNIPTSSSARPALITHFTGGTTSPIAGAAGTLSTGTGSNPGTIRIVGDMKFDPEKMCWVNLNAEDEIDPFEGIFADDEDEDLGGGGNTITRSSGRKLVSVGLTTSATSGTTGWSSRMTSDASTNLATSIASSGGASSSTGSKGHWGDGESDISPELYSECKEAEERHKKEMKGWIMRVPSNPTEVKERERKEEKRLWEIRNLAMKS